MVPTVTQFRHVWLQILEWILVTDTGVRTSVGKGPVFGVIRRYRIQTVNNNNKGNNNNIRRFTKIR